MAYAKRNFVIVIIIASLVIGLGITVQGRRVEGEDEVDNAPGLSDNETLNVYVI